MRNDKMSLTANELDTIVKFIDYVENHGCKMNSAESQLYMKIKVWSNSPDEKVQTKTG